MVESFVEEEAPSLANDSVVQALRKTSKGKLEYDTDWKGQGRTRDIVESVKMKVSALAVSPKASNQSKRLATSSAVLKNKSDDLLSIFDLNRNVNKNKQVNLIHKDHELEAYEQRRRENVAKKVESILANHHKELQKFAEDEKRNTERKILLDKKDLEKKFIERDNSLFELINKLHQSNHASNPDAVNLKLKQVQEKSQLLQKQEAQRLQEQERYRQMISANLAQLQQCLLAYQTNLEQFHRMSSDPRNLNPIVVMRADCEHFQSTIDSQEKELRLLLSKATLTEEDVEKSRKSLELIVVLSKNIQDRLIFSMTQQANQAKPQEDKPIETKESQQPKPSPVPVATKTTKPAPSVYKSPRQRYLAYKQELAEFEQLCQHFIDSTSQGVGKKRRTDLQLFVRSTINVICKTSTSHLKEQLRKLLHLLNGETVMKDNAKLKCIKTDYSFHFVINNAAKHFVDVSTKIKNVAIQLGPVIVILWSIHPDFGRLFMCHLSMSCPYVIPYFPLPEAAQNEQEYLATLGYRMLKTGSAEPEESFTERVTACIELYAMVMQCNLEAGDLEHPLNMQHAWRWLAEILNGQVAPEITALILSSFLAVASPKLSLVYGKQFRKILTFVKTIFVKKIEDSTEVTQQASLMKLKSTLEEIDFKMTRGILKLDNLVPDYFFQKSFIFSSSS